MLYCNKCKISVNGHADFCPLCHGNLSGTPDGYDCYPPLKKPFDSFMLAVRIAAFVSFAALFICAAVNYSISETFIGWWLYVAGGICSFWFLFGIAVKHRRNITKSIFFTAFFCCLTAFFWDLCTGYHGWALDIFLPETCCTAMLSMAVMARILNLRIEQYIYYMILDIVFGIIPLILLLCGVIRFIYPSVACIVASAISLTALLIFNNKALLAELSRRTHL